MTAALPSRVAHILAPFKGMTLLAAVSGGADSVALLHATVMAGAAPVVVNCNFHLRGEESDRDSRFVAALAARLGLECVSYNFDAAEYAREKGISLEMACRELRYEKFFSLLRERDAARILVAHNSDDQIETLFLNLMRGAGMKGLAGMRTDDEKILRPLLSTSRKEIESFLLAIGESHITDSSNADDHFNRNFIRHRILPLLESRWPQARHSILDSMEHLRSQSTLLAELSGINAESHFLPFSSLQGCSERGSLIHLFISPFGGSPAIAAEMERHLDNHLSGKRWLLPQATVWSERDGFRIIPTSADIPSEDPVHLFEETVMQNDPQTLAVIMRNNDNTILYSPLPLSELIFRHPLPGDRIRPLGLNGSTTVSKIMKDARLSGDEKGKIIVAAKRSDGEIIWIEGLKRSRISLIDNAVSIIYRISRR